MADPAPLPHALAALGSRLVDLEANPTVELARTGCLTGGSAAAWAEAEAGLARAWEAYRAVDEQLRAGGPGDPGAARALGEADAAVGAAEAVAARLSAAWDRLGARVAAAGTAAKDADDEPAVRAVDSVAELLAGDPLAVTEADVAEVERLAAAARDRRSAARTASARIDVDLAHSRRLLDELEAAVRDAAGELDHAASRIAGLAAARPVPDLAALGDWLDRIAAAADRDPVRAAGDLAAWRAAADARRAELDGALGPARAALRRRDEGRGLWTALRAKASARRLDERPAVAAALTAAHDELWHAPCDLAAADTKLAELSRLLETPARSAG